MLLRSLPANDRPRERLLAFGPDPLQDAELLAVILGTGGRHQDALATAHLLLARFPELRRMAQAGVAELAAVPGVGLAQACRVKASLALAGRLGERPLVRGEPLSAPADVFERVGARLRGLEREVFVAVALDVKHRVLAERRLAEGGACSVEVLPRDIFCHLVREAAAAVIFVHNHPSGDPAPSGADAELTRRLQDAGRLVGVHVLDHVIVAAGGYHSFADGRTITVGGFLDSPAPRAMLGPTCAKTAR